MPKPEPKSSNPDVIQFANCLNDIEHRIVKRLRQDAETTEGREQLIRSTGAGDPQLIEELIDLGITAEGLISLRLFPLVLVAWAEDRADGPERNTVMEEARRIGIRDDSVPFVLLDQWMTRQPPGITVDAWKRSLRLDFARMSALAQQKLIRMTEKQMVAVAKASGGILGLGKVSKKERILIDHIVSTMREQTRE